MTRPSSVQSLLVPNRNRRLMIPYLAAGVVMTVLLAIGGVIVSRSLAANEALRSKTKLTTLVAGALIEPVLEEAPYNAAQIAKLDTILHAGVLGGDVVRVKIWTNDGTIIYTDFHDAIGRKFELDSQDKSAFARGTASAKVTNLTDAENFSERQFGELISVYTGIVSPSGTPMLFELYFRHSAVDAEASRILRRFLPVGLGALILLQFIQFPLMWILSRRLAKRDREKVELTRYALDATGAVSRRIASDLHDGVVQDLVAINYSLISNAAKLKAVAPLATTERIAEEVQEAGSATRRAIQSLRSMIVDIYPPSLHEEGLERALADLLATASARGLTTSLHVGIATTTSTSRDELVYRVAQEAVRNAVQHAQATALDVSVCFAAARCTLHIADNGIGVDLPALFKVQRTGHFGLNIIKDVVETAGGTVTMESSATTGFHLHVDIPEFVGA